MLIRSTAKPTTERDDEVADLGYVTTPPLESIVSKTSVPNFVISRKGYGTITFKQPVDVSDIPTLSALRETVAIETGRVSLYKNSKLPAPGEGLNIPAQVLLENYRAPPDFEPKEFVEQLQKVEDTKFISYSVDTGTYVYSVDHF